MKIFLGDLVHTWEKVSLWTIPLNVGFVAEYAMKHLPDDVEIRLFKYPEPMIDAIRAENPDIVGLSFYVWNANLSRHMFDIAKRNDPGVLTVGGGPYFTSLNATEKDATRFFAGAMACDTFVVNQGERGFVELVKRFLDVGGDIAKMMTQPIAGCLTNALEADDCIHVGRALDAIRDLDEIPSPYLSGLLDPFFDEPLVPLIESNRSCPYRCTFCAWGIGTEKLAQFSTERVFAEIDYIGDRCVNSATISFTDANFSILERDWEIARKLYESHIERGFPAHVDAQWNKTRPDRVQRVLRELKGISEVGASMQSLNPDVLSAIKRKNLPLAQVVALLEDLRAEGHHPNLFTELILGLPEETAESHIDANKKLIDLGAEVFNYNLHLLPGTEMDTPEMRQKYFRRTGWRLHDNAFGIYDGVKVFEGQEVVIETSAMTMEELRSFRFIHFLIQFMWSRKWYYDYLQMCRHASLHPVDCIVRLAARIRADDGEIGGVYRRFSDDHALENFETFEDLAAYWSEEANLERLRSGEYGKLNYQYTYDILLDHYDAFNELLLRFAAEVAGDSSTIDREAFLAQCAEVLKFTRELRVTFTRNLEQVVESKRRRFQFDLLSWRGDGYSCAPADARRNGVEYEFYLTDRQRTILKKQLGQFRSQNANLTLRKMSEDISADVFFYHVREAGAPTGATPH